MTVADFGRQRGADATQNKRPTDVAALEVA